MGRTFFRGANLIDGLHRPKANATVVVEDERITAVGTNGRVPKPTAQDTVYDLNGKSLMPGMVQSHYHVAYANISDLNDIDMKYHPTHLALIAAKNAELLLRSGFTGAVGAGTLHNIDVSLKKAINSGLIPGPRFMPAGRDVVTTGDSVDSHPAFWNLRMEGLAYICDGPDEFRKAIRAEIKDGVEMIKLYPTGGHGLPWPIETMTMSQDEIEAASNAAHERGRKIRGHICSKKGIKAAIKAKVDLIDHGDRMDEECIELMAKNGTFLTPSMYFPWMVVEENKRSGKVMWDEIEGMSRGVANFAKMLPKANKAGVKLLIGDDFGISIMPHGDYAKELEAYVEGAGISPLDVIRWATVNGAELMGMKDEAGSIEAGKLADLLVVNGNPAKDITVLQDRDNLEVIMKGGEMFECQLSPSQAQLKAA